MKEMFSLLSEIELSMKHINEMLDTNEVCKVSAYRSNVAFRKLPPQNESSEHIIFFQDITSISEKFTYFS